jgi:hypothetical protein
MAIINTFLPVEQFNNKIVARKLSLTPKTLRQQFDPGNTYTTEPTIKKFHTIQDFFNVVKLFEENAWQSNIHQTYEYENFAGKVIKLYSLYSPQVLTYQSLASFLDLIENKFKPIIKDFIPIVINISEFGRLIQNSMFIVPKAHYPNIHRLCELQKIGNSFLQFRLFDVIPAGYDIQITLKHGDGTIFVPMMTAVWPGTEPEMELAVLQKLRSPVSNPVRDHLKAFLADGIIILQLDAEWYSTTYSRDPNDVGIVLYQPVSGFNYVGSFDYGSLDFVENDCGSLQYVLPVIHDPAGINEDYIYYDSENKPDRIIKYDSESGPDETYLEYD